MAADGAAPPVLIGLLGIAGQTRLILETVIGQQAKGRYRLVAGEAPQLAIIDLDVEDADRLWADLRSRYPDLPTLAMSAKGETRLGAVTVKKPVSPQRMLEALDGLVRASGVGGAAIAGSSTALRLGGGVRADITRATTAALDETLEDSAACGEAADFELDVHKPPAAIFYSADHRLQDACRQAMQMARQTGHNHLFAIDGLLHPLAFLPVQDGQVVTQLSWKHLRSFCLLPLAGVSNAIIPLNGLPHDLEALPRVPYEQFMWEVALWTSRGRLPEGTPLDVPLRFKHWPNFTRQLETPHAMRLAACWSAHPYSLARIIQMLGIPQRYVFGFFSAANAAGLVEWCRGYDEAQTPLLGIEHKGAHDLRHTPERRGSGHEAGDRRGLLGRILSHLLRDQKA